MLNVYLMQLSVVLHLSMYGLKSYISFFKDKLQYVIAGPLYEVTLLLLPLHKFVHP